MNTIGSESLSRTDATDKMEVDLNMNSRNIKNLKDPGPSNSQYAATVNFANKTVSDNNTTISFLIDKKIEESEDLNIKGNNEENVFSFVMDDDMFKEDDSDITKVGKVDKDFYNLYKETYPFNINYDSNIGYYSTRSGINLKPVDFGEFTLVF